MIKAPEKPTQLEWDKHQTTHTPFAPWCQHCVAARIARRNHPKQGRKGRIVSDIDDGEGPTKVSMDHMYLHERVGKHRDVQRNPPYSEIVEHRFGRCWTYQVPNKGSMMVHIGCRDGCCKIWKTMDWVIQGSYSKQIRSRP